MMLVANISLFEGHFIFILYYFININSLIRIFNLTYDIQCLKIKLVAEFFNYVDFITYYEKNITIADNFIKL